MSGALCLTLLTLAAGVAAHADGFGFADQSALMQATLGVHEHGEGDSLETTWRERALKWGLASLKKKHEHGEAKVDRGDAMMQQRRVDREKVEERKIERRRQLALYAADQAKTHERGEVLENAAQSMDMATVEDGCDLEIPKYTASEWISKHGYELPDHPAVFLEDAVDPAFKKYADFETFLSSHYADMTIDFYPEYGQPGGFGAHFPNHDIEQQSVKTMSRKWKQSHHAYSIFDNSSAMSKAITPFLKTPELFKGNLTSTNFLIGGPGAGLPFHKHEPTFQGLLSGRKLWYLVPPNKMSKAMHDTTGPFLFPTRGWRKLVDGLPLGERPLRCVQHPGEILYFPDKWYHATMNLDEFQLAWGGKPKDRQVQQSPSQNLPAILAKFNSDMDTEDTHWPFFVTYRLFELKASHCHKDAPVENALAGIKEAALVSRNVTGNSAIADLSAFAYCVGVHQLRDSSKNYGCSAAQIENYTSSWMSAAYSISPETAKTECPPTT